MADVKFSELTALTTPASADVLAIVDTDASTSKKITLDTLFGVVPVNIAVDDATDTSSGTTGSIQTDGGIGVAKAAYVGTTLTVGTDATIGDDLTLNSDAAVLNFGADSDVNLTHVADTALMLNSAIALRFRDAALGINSSTDGQLDLYADAELEITAPIVDIDASTSVNISNDLKLDSDAAVLGFGVDNDVTLTHVADTGLLLNGTMQLQFNDSSQYISSTGVIMSIVATDEIDLTATAVDLNGTLNASGLVTIQTGMVPDASDGAYLGTTALQFSDIFLADAAVINLGDDQDVTLTHVADTGVLLNSDNVIQFRDTGLTIGSSADGTLDVVADTILDLDAATVTLTKAGASQVVKHATDAYDLIFQQYDALEVARIFDGGLALNDTDAATRKGGFGFRRPVIDIDASGANKAVALTDAESGALIKINNSSGSYAASVTLPAVGADSEGVFYDFIVEANNGSAFTIQTAATDSTIYAYGITVATAGSDVAGGDVLTIAANATKGTKLRLTAAVGHGTTSNILWIAEYSQPAGTAPAVA